MTGFTSKALVSRFVAAEKSAGITYTALAALAIVKGVKWSTLETSVFGSGKPSSTFRNAKATAMKFFKARLSLLDLKVEVLDMGIEEAVDATIAAIEEHMRDLKQTSFEAYRKVADCVSAANLPPEADDAAAEAEAEAEAAPAEAELPPISAAEVEPGLAFDDLLARVAAMTDPDQLVKLAAAVNARLVDLQQAQNARKAA
ncbi:hypothetical protein ACUN0C_19125 [Faunimonas sp. B44]|uniref:hypothetical protein n=1 Tax=Faunimonas sp. B44 TaxID=3461493 RepID=UPI004044D230